jgi:hypothetical protein
LWQQLDPVFKNAGPSEDRATFHRSC